MKHAIKRTSPKGELFVGCCILCGKLDIKLRDFLREECPNPDKVPHDDALLMVIAREEAPDADAE